MLSIFIYSQWCLPSDPDQIPREMSRLFFHLTQIQKKTERTTLITAKRAMQDKACISHCRPSLLCHYVFVDGVCGPGQDNADAFLILNNIHSRCGAQKRCDKPSFSLKTKAQPQYVHVSGCSGQSS